MVIIYTTDEEAGRHVSAELRQGGYRAQYYANNRQISSGGEEQYVGWETEHKVTVQLCNCRKRDDHPGAIDIYTEWYDY